MDSRPALPKSGFSRHPPRPFAAFHWPALTSMHSGPSVYPTPRPSCSQCRTPSPFALTLTHCCLRFGTSMSRSPLSLLSLACILPSRYPKGLHPISRLIMATHTVRMSRAAQATARMQVSPSTCLAAGSACTNGCSGTSLTGRLALMQALPCNHLCLCMAESTRGPRCGALLSRRHCPRRPLGCRPHQVCHCAALRSLQTRVFSAAWAVKTARPGLGISTRDGGCPPARSCIGCTFEIDQVSAGRMGDVRRARHFARRGDLGRMRREIN